MRNGFEWLRLLTPILTGVSLFLLTAISRTIDRLDSRVYNHQINSDLHVTRSEFLQIQQQIQRMHQETLQAIGQLRNAE